jgi:polyisoprenoid-binding protein YceI
MKLTRSLSVLAILGALAATPALALDYTVDPVHTFATYRIKHMNTSFSYGRFDFPEGKVSYDAASPEKATFNLTIKLENLNTGVQKRDDHLKSPQFFNAKDFPTLTFVSTAVKKVDDKNLEVTGDLTIHGVKKSVTVKMEITGTNEFQGKKLIGFETVFDIKRTDFGMKELLEGAGDDVRIYFSLEAGA